jgi:protein phosphatase
MAAIDLLGVLFLLLAAGGAGYLFWTRRSRLGTEAVVSIPSARRRARAADTMPPTLRPDSEIPAKMAAKKEALAKASGRPPSERKLATPSNPPKKAASSPPAAKTPSARPEAAPPKSQPPEAKKSGPSNPPARDAGAVAVTVDTKPKGESKRGVPRVASDDDDDVELTRVGRGQVQAPIRPLVEKIVFDEGADAPATGESLQSTSLVYAVGQTDTGKRRKENQDAYLLIEKESVFIVADGMGGHRGGQVASKLAVTTIEQAFEKKSFEAAAHEDIDVEASELARAVQMANTAIFNEAKDNPELEGMGTTVVAARFTQNRQRLYVAHVGDSRCYRVRNGVMRQMTSDHTMADYGVTGPEGAHLSRAVGVWPTVPIDVIMATPEVGDLYLLCSDGLTKMISEGTIATQLLHEEDPKAAVSRLVFFANAHGGKDNTTVVLLRVVPQGWKPPRPSLPPPAAS